MGWERLPASWRYLAAAGLVLAAVNLVAPSFLIGLVPDCPFKGLTGYDCPLCGTTRALSALGRGELREAWSFNILAVLGVAALPLAAVFIRRRRDRGGRDDGALRALAFSAGLIVLLAYGVLRNL